jgi:preprotein translocase subunit SecG
MYTFLFTLLVLDALVLIVAILLQSGKGGGLAASFGGASSSADAVIGSRQAGNLLTKTSWWAGGIFLGLAFVLQLAGARARAPRSVLDQTFNGAAAPAPGTAGRAPTQGAAPAVPLTPAAPPAGAPAGGAPPTTPPAGAPAPR